MITWEEPVCCIFKNLHFSGFNGHSYRTACWVNAPLYIRLRRGWVFTPHFSCEGGLPSFTHPCAHSFIHSFITHSFTHPLIHALIHSFTRLLFTHLFTHSSLISSLANLFIHSFYTQFLSTSSVLGPGRGWPPYMNEHSPSLE